MSRKFPEAYYNAGVNKMQITEVKLYLMGVPGPIISLSCYLYLIVLVCYVNYSECVLVKVEADLQEKNRGII